MGSWDFGGGGWMSGSGSGVVGGKSSGGSSSGGGGSSKGIAAHAASLAAQGKAYQQSGQLSGDGKSWFGPPDPNAALEAWLAAHDGDASGYGGGGGGGGGGFDISGARSNAGSRYSGQQGQLNDLYGDYAALVKDNPKNTKKSYDTLIKQSAQAGQGIAQQASSDQAVHDTERDAGLTSLGVSQAAIDAAPSEEHLATQQGLADLAGQNSSWGNLQGVLSQAQQARDKLDIQGVGDAKVLAQRQLTQNYEDFMRQLDAQLAASSGGGGGGGGGGGSTTNKYRGKLEDAIFAQLLQQAGYKGSQNEDSGYKPSTKTSTTTKYDTNGNVIGSTKTTSKG